MLRRICVVGAAVVAFVIANPKAWGQIAQFEGKRITAVQFLPETDLAPQDLALVQPLKTGQLLRAEDIGKAIDGLFSTGYFEDISVEAEPSGGGVLIRFVTKKTSFLGGITVEGKIADPPSRGEIASEARLTLGAPFTERDLEQAVENIRRLYQANGLYEAEVTHRVEPIGKSPEVLLTLQVKPGKRARYEDPVVQGDTKLSDATILRTTGWRLPIIHWWRKVTDTRTQKGVQRLLAKYEKTDRLRAKAEITKLDYDRERRRVRPNLTVDPGPQVKVITVETKLSKRILKRYVPVFQERTVDNDLLVEGERNLHDYLQSQGYYDVNVDFRIEPAKNDVETIQYVISRGSRYKLVRVDIVGNRYFDLETLRERMLLQGSSFRLRRGRFSDAFLRKDQENLRNLYQDNGFRDVVINATITRDYQGKPGDAAVAFKIDEGTQWSIQSLSIQGVTPEKADELRGLIASSAGQPFSEGNIAADRNAVLTHYYSDGYPSATFEPSWEMSSKPHYVDLVYTIREEERQFVRNIVISGVRGTRQSLIQQYIHLHSGDPLSPVSQVDSQKHFYDLGIFARVDTAIENPDGAARYKNVLYHFEEADRYTLAFGFGAQIARFGKPSTTDLSSPGGSTGFSPEVSFTGTRLNFLGRGHTVSLRAAYSDISRRGSISYLQPRFRNVDGRNITYTLLYDDTLDVRTFSSKREEASVQISQQFTKTLTGLFQLTYRRVSVSNVIIPVLLVPQFLQPVRIGLISSNFVHDRRDNPGDPHRGIYNTISLGVAGKFLGSERSFGRALIRNATYYSLTKNVVLARQTQFGVILPFSPPPGVSDMQSVPLPERFFGGGADSLRAFPYNQAGPRDIGVALVPGGPESKPTGFPLGGNALFFNNVELRFPLIGENIQGVAFHDMGNVYSSVGNISLSFHQKDIKHFDYDVHAVGFGIRYRTPIGPIRGDLAYSINPPAYEGFNGAPFQLLQCNPNADPSTLPSFCQSSNQRISHFQFFFSIGQTF